MLANPAYAAQLVTTESFGREVLAMHRRITSLSDPFGKIQLPWPRRLGTPPWAVAGQLSALPGADGSRVDYQWQLARWSSESAFDRLVAALDAGRPAACFIGSRRLPRHVVLAVPGERSRDSILIFEPGRGGAASMDRQAFVDGRLKLAGWSTPWFVVIPSR